MRKRINMLKSALVLTLGLSITPTHAQLGKFLENKLDKAQKNKAANLDKTKLPGPYLTSNVPLESHTGNGYSEVEHFYVENWEFKGALSPGKDRVLCSVETTDKLPSLANGDRIGDAGSDKFSVKAKETDEDFLSSMPWTRFLYLKNENIYICYGAGEVTDKNSNDNIENYDGIWYVKDVSKISIYYVLAETKELAAEWHSEKGLARVHAGEKFAKEKYAASMEGQFTDVRMPKPGSMNSNTALVGKIKSQIVTQLNRDGSTLKRFMITADEWDVVRNKASGQILYRQVWGFIADENPEHGASPCMVFGYYYKEKYLGDGKYQETGTVDCCSQDPRYGPYIDCENIDK